VPWGDNTKHLTLEQEAELRGENTKNTQNTQIPDYIKRENIVVNNLSKDFPDLFRDLFGPKDK